MFTVPDIATLNQRAVGSVDITYKGQAVTLLCGTCSSRSVFSVVEMDFIISQCKAGGFFVITAVHASVAATNHALASVENKIKQYTSTIRFSPRLLSAEAYSLPTYASGPYINIWIKPYLRQPSRSKMPKPTATNTIMGRTKITSTRIRSMYLVCGTLFVTCHNLGPLSAMSTLAGCG